MGLIGVCVVVAVNVRVGVAAAVGCAVSIGVSDAGGLVSGVCVCVEGRWCK